MKKETPNSGRNAGDVPQGYAVAGVVAEFVRFQTMDGTSLHSGEFSPIGAKERIIGNVGERPLRLIFGR